MSVMENAKIMEYIIENADLVGEFCPYCGELAPEFVDCCGESSAHYELGVVIDDELFLESDIREHIERILWKIKEKNRKS